jgi:hypothetical protein
MLKILFGAIAFPIQENGAKLERGIVGDAKPSIF